MRQEVYVGELGWLVMKLVFGHLCALTLIIEVSWEKASMLQTEGERTVLDLKIND